MTFFVPLWDSNPEPFCSREDALINWATRLSPTSAPLLLTFDILIFASDLLQKYPLFLVLRVLYFLSSPFFADAQKPKSDFRATFSVFHSFFLVELQGFGAWHRVRLAPEIQSDSPMALSFDNTLQAAERPGIEPVSSKSTCENVLPNLSYLFFLSFSFKLIFHSSRTKYVEKE